MYVYKYTSKISHTVVALIFGIKSCQFKQYWQQAMPYCYTKELKKQLTELPIKLNTHSTVYTLRYVQLIHIKSRLQVEHRTHV